MSKPARKVSRRRLAQGLAAAASVPLAAPLLAPLPAQAQNGQAPAPADPELQSARLQVRAIGQALRQVDLPPDTHPAFRFEPRK